MVRWRCATACRPPPTRASRCWNSAQSAMDTACDTDRDSCGQAHRHMHCRSAHGTEAVWRAAAEGMVRGVAAAHTLTRNDGFGGTLMHKVAGLQTHAAYAASSNSRRVPSTWLARGQGPHLQSPHRYAAGQVAPVHLLVRQACTSTCMRAHVWLHRQRLPVPPSQGSGPEQ